MRKTAWKSAWGVVAACLTFIGAVDVVEDLKTWSGWLAMIDHDIARWIFLITGLCIFAYLGWGSKIRSLIGNNKKPAGSQEKEPAIQEQPPGPPEPPEEPRRGRMAWEIKAERAQQFAVYEVACLLAGTAPVWPLPTPESKEEYELLRLALLDDELGGELAYEAGFAEGNGGDESRLHLVEIERGQLRGYLRLADSQIPEFLAAEFDEPNRYVPFGSL